MQYLVRLINRIWSCLQKARAREWQRATMTSFGQCGDGVHLSPYSTFISPENITIGNNVHIGFNAWFRADGGLTIGDNTHISRNCVIFTASHNYEGELLPYDETYITKPVVIGKNVWIGMNVMIVPGVTIGEGAIIALGTVVTKEVPPQAIIGGPEHRILKYRDEKHYREQERKRRYSGHGGKPYLP